MRMSDYHRKLAFALLASVLVCSQINAELRFQTPSATSIVSNAKPFPAPSRWRGLIGEYGQDKEILYVLEKDKRLSLSFKRAQPEPLEEISKTVFKFPAGSSRAGQLVTFTRGPGGRATKVTVD